MQGVIVTVSSAGYCHAAVGNDRVMIHQNQADFRMDDVKAGDIVEIDALEDTARGVRATRASWVERPDVSLVPDRVEGRVVTILHDRLIGFLRPDDGSADVIFHCSGFRDNSRHEVSPTFRSLKRGDRLRGNLRQTQRGPRVEQVTVVAD